MAGHNMKVGGVLQGIFQTIECPICAETFTEPTALPCMHTFCQNCIDDFTKDLARGQKASCPLCRAAFVTRGADGKSQVFTKNLFADKLIEVERVTSYDPSSTESKGGPKEILDRLL